LADRYGTFFACAQEAVEHLLAVELLSSPILLVNHVRNFLDALVGGKPLAALQAFATAANRFRLLALARDSNLVIGKTAKRTFHGAGFSRFAILAISAFISRLKPRFIPQTFH